MRLLRIVIRFENVDFSFWLVLLFRQEPGPHSDHWCPLRHTLAEVLNIGISHKFPTFTKLNWSYVSLKGWALLDKLSFGEIYGQFVKSLLQHGARRLRGVYVNCELEVHVSVPLREGKRLIMAQVCTWFFSNRWSVGEREIIIPNIFSDKPSWYWAPLSNYNYPL